MSKILILANNATGLYKFRKELIKKLKTENHEMYVSVPSDNYIESIKNLNVNIIKTEFSRRSINILKDLKLFLTYSRILKKINPDIVLTYTIKPNIYGGILCRSKKIPYITNITGLGTALENKDIIQKVLIKFYKIALKKSNCIFFQNSENMQFFKSKKIVKTNYKLIPGSGVNLEEFEELQYPKSDANMEFIYAGRIMKEKGIEEYISMAEKIKMKYPNTTFHVLGFLEEDYAQRLKILQSQKIIQYHGMQKNIKPFLKRSCCTILPSYHEGVSNVLLETAASGRPAITSNIAGCRETIDDGKTGYVFETKNISDLIEKVEKFIKLPYEKKKKMGLAARKKIEKEFNRRIILNAYMHEINNIKKERK